MQRRTSASVCPVEHSGLPVVHADGPAGARQDHQHYDLFMRAVAVVIAAVVATACMSACSSTNVAAPASAGTSITTLPSPLVDRQLDAAQLESVISDLPTVSSYSRNALFSTAVKVPSDCGAIDGPGPGKRWGMNYVLAYSQDKQAFSVAAMQLGNSADARRFLSDLKDYWARCETAVVPISTAEFTTPPGVSTAFAEIDTDASGSSENILMAAGRVALEVTGYRVITLQGTSHASPPDARTEAHLANDLYAKYAAVLAAAPSSGHA